MSETPNPEDEELDLASLLTGPKYIDVPLVPGVDNLDLDLQAIKSRVIQPVKQEPQDQVELRELVKVEEPAPAPPAASEPEQVGEPPTSSLVTSKGTSAPVRYLLGEVDYDQYQIDNWPPKEWADDLYAKATRPRPLLNSLTPEDRAGLVKFLGGEMYGIGAAVTVIVTPQVQTDAERVAQHLKVAEKRAVIFAMLRTSQVSMDAQLGLMGFKSGYDYEWVGYAELSGHERAVLKQLLHRAGTGELLGAIRRLK